MTSFAKNPVRFLTRSDTGVLCFGYDGEIYTQAGDAAPQKLAVRIAQDGRAVLPRVLPVGGSGLTEMRLSPNGKEIALVFRGEIFVVSAEGGPAKRVTDTPEQERMVSFSPDGRTLIYAAERDNNWNVYATSIVRKEEPYFFAATLLKEEPVAATAAEEFQPEFSPDGKEVAYLENRTALKVINLATKQSRLILPGTYTTPTPTATRATAEPGREVVSGPIWRRPPLHPLRSALRPRATAGPGHQPDPERIRQRRRPLGPGRDDDVLRLDPGGLDKHGRQSHDLRYLRDVFHPGGVRPVPPLQGRIRFAEGNGAKAKDEKEKTEKERPRTPRPRRPALKRKN